MIVFENVVTEKVFTLVNKTEQQDLEAARCEILLLYYFFQVFPVIIVKLYLSRFALKTLAIHQAVGYALIKEMGGPQKFFEKFPILEFEVFAQPTAKSMMEPMEFSLAILVQSFYCAARANQAKPKAKILCYFVLKNFQEHPINRFRVTMDFLVQDVAGESPITFTQMLCGT